MDSIYDHATEVEDDGPVFRSVDPHHSDDDAPVYRGEVDFGEWEEDTPSYRSADLSVEHPTIYRSLEVSLESVCGQSCVGHSGEESVSRGVREVDEVSEAGDRLFGLRVGCEQGRPVNCDEGPTEAAVSTAPASPTVAQMVGQIRASRNAAAAIQQVTGIAKAAGMVTVPLPLDEADTVITRAAMQLRGPYDVEVNAWCGTGGYVPHKKWIRACENKTQALIEASATLRQERRNETSVRFARRGGCIPAYVHFVDAVRKQLTLYFTAKKNSHLIHARPGSPAAL